MAMPLLWLLNQPGISLSSICYPPGLSPVPYSPIPDNHLQNVLDSLEGMHHHLTAAIVSKDINFIEHVLAHTVNGTTYAGIRARTTGAPQNHWFGPAGDPRGAGIGTPEAIRLVWSCHREVIYDHGPVVSNNVAALKTT
jgi:hypothetical protein